MFGHGFPFATTPKRANVGFRLIKDGSLLIYCRVPLTSRVRKPINVFRRFVPLWMKSISRHKMKPMVETIAFATVLHSLRLAWKLPEASANGTKSSKGVRSGASMLVWGRVPSGNRCRSKVVFRSKEFSSNDTIHRVRRKHMRSNLAPCDKYGWRKAYGTWRKRRSGCPITRLYQPKVRFLDLWAILEANKSWTLLTNGFGLGKMDFRPDLFVARIGLIGQGTRARLLLRLELCHFGIAGVSPFSRFVALE